MEENLTGNRKVQVQPLTKSQVFFGMCTSKQLGIPVHSTVGDRITGLVSLLTRL